MNYYEIGQRIRKNRKAQMLSQEELAEKVGISVTHMSHIETGNTKLSLQVLVELSKVLNVSTDDLLFSSSEKCNNADVEKFFSLIKDCPSDELNIIYDIIKSTKTALKRFIMSINASNEFK